jgi:curved DNA-binding protein CbpA
MDAPLARRHDPVVDLYEVLLVSHNADVEVIRAAYRVLARRHHPDVGGDPRRMTAVNEAWAVLGDPIGRRRYDAIFRKSQAQASVATEARATAARVTDSWATTAVATASAARPTSGPATATNAAAATSSASDVGPSTADQSSDGSADRPAARPPTPGVIDFGRYAGWSVSDLSRHDPDYLLWLERTPIGRPMRSEIQRALEMRRDGAGPSSNRQPDSAGRRGGGRFR